MSQLEKGVAKDVKEYLESMGHDVVRLHTGGNTITRGGKTFRAKNPNKGLADFLVFHGKLPGVVFWVETKRSKGGRLSEEQKQWKARIEGHGGLYIVARSEKDVAIALEERYGQ